ncbi:MAG: ribonuclease protein component [Patescibacteria group bacterium]|nr:ribonuclease protein component [Patescibacteria group bacterium]
MIGRANRFHGYGSLRYAYRHGKTVRGPLMGLRYCPNPKRSDYRLAVVVSKKVHKSAVTRNRIRRRLYELLRTSLRSDQPFDLVVTVFSANAADAPIDELREQVLSLIEQAKLEQTVNN